MNVVVLACLKTHSVTKRISSILDMIHHIIFVSQAYFLTHKSLSLNSIELKFCAEWAT